MGKRRESSRAIPEGTIPEGKSSDSDADARTAWEHDAPTLAALSIGEKKSALTTAIVTGCDAWVEGRDDAAKAHWREHKGVTLTSNPKFQTLARLLIGYRTISGDGVFFVSVNKVARVLSVSKDCASKWLWVMRLAGYLELVADTEHGKARRYRFADNVSVTGVGGVGLPF